MIEATVVLDSINPAGKRITTLILNYPRFVHSEFLTHRMFSKNSASSRAVPIEKMIEKVQTDPAMPVWWGKNQKGMQAKEELTGFERGAAESAWIAARDGAVSWAEQLNRLGVHKQIANRVLEPWLHIQVCLTATEFDNFFELRDHTDAQPEIRAVAIAMKEAMKSSTPRVLQAGEWHIPFISEDENNLHIRTKLMLSVARCARTSYYFHDGKTSTVEQDIELHNRLVQSVPRHASPSEHQAISMPDIEPYRNFRGWRQYRAYIENNESI